MEYRTINELLSLDDLKRLGMPDEDHYCFDQSVFRYMFLQKYHHRQFVEEFHQEFYRRICQFPKLKKIFDSCTSLSLKVTIFSQEDGTSQFGFQIAEVGAWFLAYFISGFRGIIESFVEKPVNDGLFSLPTPQMISELKQLFRSIVRSLNEYLDTVSESSKNDYLEDRSIANYLSRHLEEVVEVFQKPVDLDSLQNINGDRFCLLMATRTIVNLEMLNREEDISNRQERIKLGIRFFEKYLLLVRYLNSRSKQEYNTKYIMNGVEFSYQETAHGFEDFYNENREVISSMIEDLDSATLFRKYLKDACQKIRKDDFVKSIQFKFQIFPEGEGERVLSVKNHLKQVKKTRTNEEDNQLLDEKLAFYPTTDFSYILEGIDTYQGYSGYLYENGIVVLDKFYQVTKKGIVAPSHYESIVIMDIEDFMKMSQYSKLELIDLIRSHNNRSVRRIYHSPGWQERVRKAIERKRENYSFESIDEILKEIVDDKNVTLEKEL